MKNIYKKSLTLIFILISIFILVNLKYIFNAKDEIPNSLRVATFNSFGMIDEIDDIKNYLVDNKIDIIGFQEVNYINDYQKIKSNTINYVKNFPTGYYFKPNYGEMIATKFHIADSKYFNMPDSTPEPRILTRSIFDFNGKKISFYITHLNASNSNIDRNNQVYFILNTLNNDTNKYKILVGDFNFRNKNEFNIFLDNGYKIVNGKDDKWFSTYKGYDKEIWGNSSLDNIIVSSNIIINNIKMETQYLQKSDHNLLYADILLDS